MLMAGTRIPKVIKNISHILYIAFITYLVTRSPKQEIRKIVRFLPDMKHILIWTPIHNLQGSGQKMFIEKKCPKINCYLTNNRTMFGDTRYFDAILFNLQDVSLNAQDIPSSRSPHQKFIFTANDSSVKYPVCNSFYDNYFNWTWTYRSDSTISYKFISVYDIDNYQIDTNFEIHWLKEMGKIDNGLKKEFNSKTIAAAWFSDECQTLSEREKFVANLRNELAHYNLAIDIFGKCGDKKCRKRKSCLWTLRKYYYFYLALEDSIAEDYITDLVVNAYKSNAVPIVFGGANYSNFLPPMSYLNGFILGEKAIAREMYLAIKDKTNYYEYFRWKNHYIIGEAPVLDVCSLCEKLNNPRYLATRFSFKNFRNWWNPKYEKVCGVRKNSLFL